MSDETRKTTSSEFQSSPVRPPRQIIEDLIETLQMKNSLSANPERQFNQSIKSLLQCIALRGDHHAYIDAVERAPWLTADVEQLKRQWTQLEEGLHAIYECARHDETPLNALIDQLNGFAERFLECEADEQCFLQAAFPPPSWITENQAF